MQSLTAALIFTALVCIQAANVIYVPTPLVSGTQYILARVSNTDKTLCSYYQLKVPSGSGAVQVDIVSPKSAPASLSVSAGFNYHPRAEQDTDSGPANLFTDSISSGQSARYTLCSYDPATSSNLDNSISTGSKNSASCSAFVPDMIKGGNVVVCLSASSTSSSSFTGIYITMTSVAATTVVLNADTTLNLPTSTTGTVNAYNFVVPARTVGFKLTTADSSASAVQIYGIGSNPNRGFGSFNADTTYQGQFISASTSAQTATVTVTSSPCTAPNYSVYTTTSNGYCIPMTQATVGTYQASFTTVAANTQYSAFNLSVPVGSDSVYFYSMNVSIPSNWTDVSLLFNGVSYNALAGKMIVGPSMALATKNSVDYTVVNGQRQWIAKFLVPSTAVQFTLSSSGKTGAIPVTISFGPETSSEIVYGTTTLDDANTLLGQSTSMNVAQSIAVTKFVSTGANHYDITVSSASSGISNVQIMSSDFRNVIAATRYVSGTSKINMNVQSTQVPAGTYNIVAFPYSSGQRTITFNVKKTIISSSASATYVSIAVIITAVFMLL